MKRVIVIILAIVSFLLLCSSAMSALPNGAVARLGKGTIYDIALSPDGKTLAVSTWQGIYFYNSSTLEQVDFIESESSSVLFSPDGNMIADGAGKRVILWNLKNHSQIGEFESPSYMFNLAFSPDSRLLATCGWIDDSRIYVWDVKKGKEAIILDGHQKEVKSISFSMDGKLLASGSADKTVILWDMVKYEQVASLNKHADVVSSVAFSPDGKLLASGSYNGTMILWDPKNYKQIAKFDGLSGSVYSIAFSPDTKLLACGYMYGTIKLWDVESHKEVAKIDGINDPNSIRFSSGGKTLMIYNRYGICYWDIEDPKKIAKLEFKEHPLQIYASCFSPNGSMLASGGNDVIRIWDVKSVNEIDRLAGHSSTVRSIQFSPNGKLLASGSWDNKVKLWDVASHREIASLDASLHVVKCVAFSPDGRILANSGWDGTRGIVKLWNVADRREVITLKMENDNIEIDNDNIESLSFSPDGNLLAGGSYNGLVKLWNVPELKEITTLKGHRSGINSINFSPNGKLLASGNLDGTIILWDMKPYISNQAAQSKDKLAVSWGAVKNETYSFSVGQNYPNPFNPETWIPYQLFESADVNISIYTESGQLVRKLILGHKEAGSYLDRPRAGYWDGKDESCVVSSGVYFYKLEAGSYHEIKKMILMR